MNTQRSVSDIIRDADRAEDLDRMFLHTAAINLVVAAAYKLGGRANLNTDDMRRLSAIMNLIDEVEPVRRGVPNERPATAAAELPAAPARPAQGQGRGQAVLDRLATLANANLDAVNAATNSGARLALRP